MKKTTYLLFIIYFLILVTGGAIFYFKYMRNYSNKTAPINVELISTRDFIYYVKTNTLYRVDPNNPTKIDSFVAQGEISQIDINKAKSEIVYEAKNSSGNWEIWQGDANNIQKEKIASQDVATFKNWDNFSNPNYSLDKTKLAILAEGKTSDAIFIKNENSSNWQNITSKNQVKIADYSWSQDSKKIIYCSKLPVQTDTKNACFTVNLDNLDTIKAFDANVKNISWENTDSPFYLSGEQTSHIYTTNLDSKVSTQVDNVVSPTTIINFKIDPQGKKIVYEVVSAEKSDIYLSNVDGSNRLQLTTDGASSQPLFSPLENKVAYLRQANGIYVIGLDDMADHLIVTLNDSINSLNIWK